MKSRFLASSTVVFALLLGLASSNLLAQITDASTVKFYLKAFRGTTAITAFNSTSTGADTVGHMAQVEATFDASQPVTSAQYTITFPAGTVLLANAADSVYIQYQEGSDNPSVQVKVTPTVTANDSATGTYSATATPSIKITDTNSWTTIKTVRIYMYKGIYLPKSVAANSAVISGQHKMKFKLEHSITTNPTFYDSTSFYVMNDLADKIRLNGDVTAFISADYFANSDSIVVLDRFGNTVPDFFKYVSAVTDTMLLTVTSTTDVGTFSTPNPNTGDGSTVIGAIAANVLKKVSDDTLAFIGQNSATGYEAITGHTYGTTGIFQGVNTTGTTNASDEAIVLFLGNKGSGSVAGIKFTAVDGVTSVAFKFTLKGPKVSSGTVLNVASSHVTTQTLDVLGSSAGKTIGTLTLALTTTGTTYNGDAIAQGGALTMTLKNRFGDLFATSTVIGTGCDSVRFTFQYLKYNEDDEESVLDAAMTTVVQNGKTVSSMYTRPPTRLKVKAALPSGGSLNNAAAAPYGSVLTGSTLTSGVATLTGAIYLGTSSHAYGDSIRIIASAFNNSDATDTVTIKVEPSAPVAFDLDTLKANLASANSAGQVVKATAIPYDMPIFALDTSYNRVSNLDLKYDTPKFLDDVVTATTGKLDAIVFKYDDRTLLDTITVDIAGASTATAGIKGDSSYIYNIPTASFNTDSSRINLGGLGTKPLNLKVNALGNHVISMAWNPSNLGHTTSVLDGVGERSLDLGLFKLIATQTTPSSNDSVQTIAKISAPDTVDAVGTMSLSFILPIGNSIGPDIADSLIYVKFPGLTGSAGVMESLPVDSVEISLDGSNYYPVTSVSQDASNRNSLTIETSVSFNTTTAAKTVYLKIMHFKNPTLSDVNYSVQVSTEASPIWATKSNLWMPTDGHLAMLKITAIDSTIAKADTTLAKVVAQSSLAMKAGVKGYIKVAVADRYGNILSSAATSDRIWTALTVDSTATGKANVVKQGAKASSGNNAVDTLTVATGAVGDGKFGEVDSLGITPAVAGTYDLVLTDTLSGGTATISLVVSPTVAGSFTNVTPKGTQATSRSTVVDSALTVTLRDTQGNALADSIVKFAVTYGSGTFVDSQGVAVATPNDTIWVKTSASGVAMVTLKTGTSDTVKVAASISSVTSSTFMATTLIVAQSGPSQFDFTAMPDSALPDTVNAQTIDVTITDGDGIKEIIFTALTDSLELDTLTGLFTPSAMVDTLIVDDTLSSSSTQEVDKSYTIAAKKLANRVRYWVKVIDAQDSVTVSGQMEYVVKPKRGTTKMTPGTTVTVTSIMRLVYLFVLPEEVTPTIRDYFGLDLDGDGSFTETDLSDILKIWKGTGTALAANSEQQQVSAKLSLATKEVDKANMNLMVNLDNQGDVNYLVFKVKYDASKYSIGEIARTERVDNSVQVVYGTNKTDGILTVVVLNLTGRSISTGSGSILNIPVQALNGKFDGSGEISLLSATFDSNVTAELSKEVLSPKATLPKAYALGQNYPNPFNPSTTVAYDIPEGKDVQVRLNVYNIRGQLVRTLVDGVKSEGSYQIQWDGTNNYGQQVSSGVYFYRLQAGDFNQTRKMVILK